MPVPTSPRRSLAGRVVLVTGVVAGIGREVVRRLDAADAVVIGADRDTDRFPALQREQPRLQLPHMLERRDGDVLVVSSGAAWVSTPPLTVYASTKFGVDGFVEGVRREVWRRGVRVHSVNPGPVRTEWLSRSRGYEPREDDPAALPSRGVPADWVARAVEHSLTRGYAGYASVPRPVGLGRLLRLQPLRGLTDLGVGLAAGRLGALGRAAAERRTP